jgi:hypothetical protein
MEISERDAAGARARLGTADRTLYGVTQRIREVKARPWQLIRNRRRLAECEQVTERARLLLAECHSILDGSRRACCPTRPGESHLGTCLLSAMNTGSWNL